MPICFFYWVCQILVLLVSPGGGVELSTSTKQCVHFKELNTDISNSHAHVRIAFWKM